ncbi:MAG: dUTP diphosphatase [Gemmiger sp.]|nr:dUTP diphosphatase [Gemmiger sp.]
MERKPVKYTILSPGAKAPAYATPGAAAADLCALLDAPLTLAPGQRAMVPTGLAIELPGPDCVALLYARSGLAVKHGLTLSNCVGVIDSDYRGEVRVGLINQGTDPYTIAPGERIAQLCIAPVWQADFIAATTLTDTQRGAGGFGSTGRQG